MARAFVAALIQAHRLDGGPLQPILKLFEEDK
jgi:hypothetical protein